MAISASNNIFYVNKSRSVNVFQYRFCVADYNDKFNDEMWAPAHFSRKKHKHQIYAKAVAILWVLEVNK